MRLIQIPIALAAFYIGLSVSIVPAQKSPTWAVQPAPIAPTTNR